MGFLMNHDDSAKSAKYKACLVVRGCAQVTRKVYEEIYSSLVKYTS